MHSMAVLRDWAVPLALVALTVADTVANGTSWLPAPAPVSLAVLLLMPLGLAVRRSRPGFVATISSTLVAVYLLVLQRDLSQQPPLEPFLVLLVAFFSLGARASRRVLTVAGCYSAVVVLTVEGLAVTRGRPPGDVVPSLIFWAAALAVGRLLFYRQREATAQRERARLAEEDRDLHAKQAAIEERTRIARELHDVVAHSLSVMVIQASVEARLLPDQEGSTARTLRTIETTGRAALVELRGLLGLLRTEGETGTPMQPLPSLREVETLVEQRRDAGLDVSLEVTGERRELPAGVDLSGFRIVQEALTNVAKHAPGATSRVHLAYHDDAVVVSVEDEGGTTAGPLAGHGTGHGLAGIRERVAVYGGELTAGPRPGGGFAVCARLPVAPADEPRVTEAR